jgi:hypothetical protein
MATIQERFSVSTLHTLKLQNGGLQACLAETKDSSNNYLAIPPGRTPAAPIH